MILPLVVLAIGALVAGFLNFPERDNSLAGFLGKSPSFALAYEVAEKATGAVSPMPFGQLEAAKHEEETNRDTVADEKHTELMLMWASSGISILGIYLAFVMHLKNRRRGDELPNKMPQLARLLEGKYWVDEIYQDAIVEPLRALGRIFFAIDRYVVDGVVWLISFIPQASGWALKLTTQQGYLQGYAATMLFGIAIILLIIFL